MTVQIIVATSEAVLRDPPVPGFEDDAEVLDKIVRTGAFGSVVTVRLSI